MGVLESVVVPFPSWPSLLPPQHRIVPSESSAQVRPDPAAIALAPLNPLTAMGVVLESVMVPFPSWPSPSPPQHLMVASESKAQV
jgi:hypothetical protein